MAIRGHGSVLGAISTKCRPAFRRRLVIELLEDRTLLSGANHPPVAVDDSYIINPGQQRLDVLSPPSASLFLKSDPGEFIGQGKTVTYTPADGPILVIRDNPDHAISVFKDSPSGGQIEWQLIFDAPGDAVLKPGTYLSARRYPRYPTESVNSPGLFIGAGNRDPGDLTGSFTVLEIAYDPSGRNVLSFDATFEQHASGLAPALRGEIKFKTNANGVGVLQNDSDADKDPLTAILVSPPSHGSVELNPDGTFTYLIGDDFSGSDHFTYKANDGMADSNVATVSISNMRLSNILPVVAPTEIYGPGPNASQEEAFVKGVYRTVLGRDADSDGLSFWVGNLDSGSARSTLVTTFWNSPENRGREVDAYYRVYLGRPADAGGHSYWVSQLQGGTDETAIALSFLLSAEQLSAPNDVFVQRLYQGALGRAASPSEVSYRVGQLTQGTTRQQVASAFIFSSEAAGVAVDSVYQAYLQRPSEPDGRAYWVGQISNRKTSYASLAISLLESDEFFQNAGSHVP